MNPQTQIDFDAPPVEPRFKGADYQPERDKPRLGAQYQRVLVAMSDGQWRDLDEIRAITGDPQASISRQLRYAKAEGHTIEKRHRGDAKHGLYEYRVKS